MDRERARVVLVGVLCILAVVTAAATLASPEETATSSGGDSIQDDGPDESQGQSGSSNADPLGEPGELGLSIGTCIPWLYSQSFWGLVLAAAIVVWLIARYRADAVAATASVSMLGVAFAFVWLLLSKCGTSERETRTTLLESDLDVTPAGGDGAFGLFGDGGVFGAPIWLVLALAVVGVGAVAVAVVREREEAEEPDDEVPEVQDAERFEDAEGLGAVAGRAADRIERSSAVDNEIYRSWVEMTSHLDVDHPDANTPGEFASAAVDAGVDPDTVTELTGLFERVRYGDEVPSDETEARAVAALRAIEAAHTEPDGGWDTEE